MFVCGQNAYSYLPPYCRGSCYVAYVGPALDIVTLEHLKGNATIRSKRDLFHQNFPVATPTQSFFCYHSTLWCHSCSLKIKDFVHIIDAIANTPRHGLTDFNRGLEQ